MEKKKICLIVGLVLVSLMLIPIPMKLKDGGSVEYKALLYKYTKVHRMSEQSATGYEDGWELKILGYHVAGKINISVQVLPSIKTINDTINDYFSKDNVDKSNIAHWGIDEEKNVVVVGMLDISIEKQNEFMSNVFFSCCDSKYIEYIKEHKMIEFQESIDIFDAKIIEVKEDYMIVMVLKDCKSFKKDDKVRMKITRPASEINYFYVVGNVVRITFNGMVETSKPAQIGASKIELITD